MTAQFEHPAISGRPLTNLLLELGMLGLLALALATALFLVRRSSVREPTQAASAGPPA